MILQNNYFVYGPLGYHVVDLDSLTVFFIKHSDFYDFFLNKLVNL